MKILRMILFLLAVLSVEVLALTASIAEGNPTTFYVGERAFIAVYISETDALLKSEEGHYGTSPYVLTNVSGNAAWLSPVGRPEWQDGTALNTNDPGNIG